MDGFTELVKNASDTELVERIILDADSNPSPHLQYLACKDVESWAAGKKNMDELEFFKYDQRSYNLRSRFIFQTNRTWSLREVLLVG